MECFILEKFRVTSRNPREKNFHVFYALFAGLSEQQLAQLGLDESIESYRSVLELGLGESRESNRSVLELGLDESRESYISV